jgi:hypothetical protein
MALHLASRRSNRMLSMQHDGLFGASRHVGRIRTTSYAAFSRPPAGPSGNVASAPSLRKEFARAGLVAILKVRVGPHISGVTMWAGQMSDFVMFTPP